MNLLAALTSNGREHILPESEKNMIYNKCFMDTTKTIGFESKSGRRLIAVVDYFGNIFIDATPLTPPSLTPKQARKFANKILGFCDRIEGTK